MLAITAKGDTAIATSHLVKLRGECMLRPRAVGHDFLQLGEVAVGILAPN